MSTSKWLSANPDKAWGETLFLTFIPVFFAYNALVQGLGWLDAGSTWHVVQNLGMWVPYCVVLPAWLRRKSGVRWMESYWFKLNVYMAVYIFYATYFHTEYFFEVLGLRYRFTGVSPALHFDSFLLGPPETTALAELKKVPVGMYFNSVAFFIVYHTAAVVCMRRVWVSTAGLSRSLRRLAWAAIVAVAALFFAWAETYLYVTSAAVANVWYVDVGRMLRVGSFYYALYFVVSFPNVYRLDEDPAQAKWTISRCIVEASFVSMLTMLLLDLAAWWAGAIV